MNVVFIISLGVLPLLGGIGVLGWQLFHWFDAGLWAPVSMLDVLSWAKFHDAWVQAPLRWIGLWKILAWFPASLGCILYGGGMTIIFVKAD